MRDRVRVISEELLSDSWALVKKTTIELQRSNGDWQRQVRETYDRGDGAATLLCDPDRGMVVLTRQFRFPAYYNGDSGALIEVCAGKLEGDDPLTCAKREAEEEAGYHVIDIRQVFNCYMSPGSLTEKLSLFIATYDPSSRISDGGGLEHEGEDIEVLEIAFEEAMAMVGRGEIADAKTIMLLQYAALNGVFPTR